MKPGAITGDGHLGRDRVESEASVAFLRVRREEATPGPLVEKAEVEALGHMLTWLALWGGESNP